AATVNGKRISTERVFSLLRDRKVAADRSAQAGAAADLAGPGKDTFTKRSFVDTLNQIVISDLVNAELARRHLQVKSSDLASAKTSLETSAGKSTVANLPKGMQSFVVAFSAAQSLLQRSVGTKAQSKEAQARAQYAQIAANTPEQLRELCITGAAFSTQAEAATARARLVKGASIAAAVKGLQVQQAAEKEQCAAASGFPPALQKLAPGGITAPIANSGNYVVLRLERRKTLSFAEVRAQLEKSLPQPGAAELQAEIGKLTAQAKVSVNPRFGTWSRQAGKVEPPAGTPTTAAPVTSAPVTTPAAAQSGG
ncbi:MAG: peptidylprolyl isomerase, partial [Actinomycetota bacterium]|nr:peptidylprolyl isomerase [Actinomycetota bacterium]